VALILAVVVAALTAACQGAIVMQTPSSVPLSSIAPRATASTVSTATVAPSPTRTPRSSVALPPEASKTPIPPYPDTTEPTFGPASVQQGDFELAVTTDATEYSADHPILARATFVYLGSENPIRLASLGPGPLGWGIASLDDGTDFVEPDWTLACQPFEMTSGKAVHQSFTKFAGPSGMNGEQQRQWLLDPDLKLPVGRWMISVVASFGPDGVRCGDTHMRASTPVVVR